MNEYVEGVGGVGVQGVQRGMGVFCKNLLHVSSRYMFMHQVDIGTYIKLIHPYRPSSFFLRYIIIINGR